MARKPCGARMSGPKILETAALLLALVIGLKLGQSLIK